MQTVLITVAEPGRDAHSWRKLVNGPATQATETESKGNPSKAIK